MTPLRRRMLDEMTLWNYAPSTQAEYVRLVSRLAQFHDRSPDQLGPEEVRAFLVHLGTEAKLSPGTIKSFVSAFRFLYKDRLGPALGSGEAALPES